MSALEFSLDLRQSAHGRALLTLEADVAALPGPDPRDGTGAAAFFLPVWTPGSYLVREYARHLQGFTAHDAATDAPLRWRKSAKNRFAVDVGDARRLRLGYEIYGHELTVRTNDFTDRHALWNGACTFLWPVGGNHLDADIDVLLPDGWSVASQLPAQQTATATRLRARDLDAVVDAPGLAGVLDVREFEALDRPHSFVFDGLEGLPVPERLIPQTQRILAAAAAIFGGPPPYERYQFLALFADDGRGGLEHTDSSTLLAARTSLAKPREYEDFMGLVAHEFFHVWSGKRMRPRELWEFDYERENHTRLLWVVEGFTSYYDDHLCRRAGVLTPARYLELIAEQIAAMHATPGRLADPLANASFDAWIKLYRPHENSRNATQSYYSHGALATMCFDLRIRAATGGARSLDDAVAALYRSTYGAGRGYDHDDVVACLSEAAGEDLEPLVRELVEGPFDPDFDAFLAPFGLRTAPRASELPRFGLQFLGKQLVVASVRRDGPAMAAGIAPGDELLALEGLRVTHDRWKGVLRGLGPPAGPWTLLLARRGRVVERLVEPVVDPRQGCAIVPVDGATADQNALRRAWLCDESA